jgi:transcriptional regulator with XRE-family HTH domain
VIGPQLRALRRLVGRSQVYVAEAMRSHQPRLSTMERSGTDIRLGTLRKYVEACGGRLEVVVHFPDREPIALAVDDVPYVPDDDEM